MNKEPPKYDDKALIHYQKSWEHALHSDRLTAEIGMFALKMAVSVNGAALVAILAAYPSLAKNDPALAEILPDVGFFMVNGLIAALVSALLAYFFQGQATAMRWSEHNESHSEGQDSLQGVKWLNWIVAILQIGFVVAWLVSAVLFIIGCFKLVSAL